jgi:hypothetical protein
MMNVHFPGSDGRVMYDREFLIRFKDDCREKPKGLEILLDLIHEPSRMGNYKRSGGGGGGGGGGVSLMFSVGVAWGNTDILSNATGW